MIRRLLILLILCLAPLAARAADPVARITGPAAATVGDRVLLDVTGSVSDQPLQVQAIAPDAPTLRVWFDEAGHPGLVVMTTTRPGTYILLAIAAGVPDGQTVPRFRFASWAVQVQPVAPSPTPTPEPTPAPGPAPTPTPAPGPAPVAGSLYGMYVLPDHPTAAQSALRTSPAVHAAFSTANAHYSSYLVSASEIQAVPSWRDTVSLAGGPPCVLWIDGQGKIVAYGPVVDATTFTSGLKVLRGAK